KNFWSDATIFPTRWASLTNSRRSARVSCLLPVIASFIIRAPLVRLSLIRICIGFVAALGKAARGVGDGGVDLAVDPANRGATRTVGTKLTGGGEAPPADHVPQRHVADAEDFEHLSFWEDPDRTCRPHSRRERHGRLRLGEGLLW